MNCVSKINVSKSNPNDQEEKKIQILCTVPTLTTPLKSSNKDTDLLSISHSYISPPTSNSTKLSSYHYQYNEKNCHALVEAHTHNGMEVIFSTTPFSNSVTVVASRTRSTIQILRQPYSSRNGSGKIVGLHCQVQTGLLCVVIENGWVYTYRPVQTKSYHWMSNSQRNRTHPSTGSMDIPELETPGSYSSSFTTPYRMGGNKGLTKIFSPYIWIPNRIVQSQTLFLGIHQIHVKGKKSLWTRRGTYEHTQKIEEEESDNGLTPPVQNVKNNVHTLSTQDKHGRSVFQKEIDDEIIRRRQEEEENEKYHREALQRRTRFVSLSSSRDYHVLLASGDQLALFDVSPLSCSQNYKIEETQESSETRSSIGIPTVARASFSPFSITSKHSSILWSNFHDNANVDDEEFGRDGELLWSMCMGATVLHADISGDGHALVYVLEGEGYKKNEIPSLFGVRTLVREKENVTSDRHCKGVFNTGKSHHATVTVNGNAKSSNMYTEPSCKNNLVEKTTSTCFIKKDLKKNFHIKSPPIPSKTRHLYQQLVHDSILTLSHYHSVTEKDKSEDVPFAPSISHRNTGIVYKPGPFLVHTAPVTRITFRRLGNINSSINRRETVENEEGNDLLLTSCASDGTMNVWCQGGGWKRLLHWETPPGSRVDWIRGWTGCNLGDLDPYPSPYSTYRCHETNVSESSLKKKQPRDYRYSKSISYSEHGSPAPTAPPALAHLYSPQACHFGAWISELTFRGPYPALRLSRLSYLPGSSGDEDQSPAHFESVASILPPGTLLSHGVLYGRSGDDYGGSEHCSLIVQGLWPAWDPWEVHPGSAHGLPEQDETLGGSAMRLMGATPRSTYNVWGYEENMEMDEKIHTVIDGGTHIPPSELRLVACHPVGCRVSVIEFALWGDLDLGVMELGNPLLYVLNLDDDIPLDLRVFHEPEDAGGLLRVFLIGNEGKETPKNEAIVGDNNMEHNLTEMKQMVIEKEKMIARTPLPVTTSTRISVLDFKSQLLCASVSDDRKLIWLSWRKMGTMNIVPLSASLNICEPSFLSPTIFSHNDPILERISSSGKPRSGSYLSFASTTSVDSAECQDSYQTFDEYYLNCPFQRFEDLSVVPLPLSLPALRLPYVSWCSDKNEEERTQEDQLSILNWFPDTCSGPPLLLALTTSGTLLLYEIPSPWVALEPSMPSNDPFDSNFSSIEEKDEKFEDRHIDNTHNSNLIYIVMITPHPHFGLGLRLEAQTNGKPAVAGSFKKHPLSGGLLPAEETNMIKLGDELLAVNNISLEYLEFEEVISTVRSVGASTNGAPLRMKFRVTHCEANNRKDMSYSSFTDEENVCQSIDEIILRGFGREVKAKTKGNQKGVERNNDYQETLSLVSDPECQQEYGRVVAVVRNALPSCYISPSLNKLTNEKFNARKNQSSFIRSLITLPWNLENDTSTSNEIHSKNILLVWAIGRTITASQLNVLHASDPEKSAILSPLGSIIIKYNSNLIKETNISVRNDSDIQNLVVIKSALEGWCIATCDGHGVVNILFIRIINMSFDSSTKTKKNNNTNMSNQTVKFHQHMIFQCHHNGFESREYLLRASSVELLAVMPVGVNSCDKVTVWSSFPLFGSFLHKMENYGEKEILMNNHTLTLTHHDEKDEYLKDNREPILDFRWVLNGSFDTFPWLVTLGRKSAIVHCKCVLNSHWKAIAEVMYPVSSSVGISASFYKGSLSPADAYPHLIPALQTVISVTNERRIIRSDFHPDSILARICTEAQGVSVALNRNIMGLFTWLSQWMSEQNCEKPYWDDKLTLTRAPLSVIESNRNLLRNCEVENDKMNCATIFMNIPSSQNLSSTTMQEEVRMSTLLDALQPTSPFALSDTIKNITPSYQSKEFDLTMEVGSSSKKPKDEKNSYFKLPDPLVNLSKDELCFLWAVGHLLEDKSLQQSSFSKMDQQAQLCYFSFALVRQILKSKYDDLPLSDGNNFKSSSSHPGTSSPNRMLSMDQKINLKKKKPSWPSSVTIASASCLLALTSDTQHRLLHACRGTAERFDWETARAVHLPFWLRSDDILKRVSEEIGQDIYKKKKDVMLCALFYLAIGSMDKLKIISATDKSPSGIKFFDFINKYDFSSPSGRSVAEKNAYSLLRKRRYIVASAFFLLTSPPMLKSALEIILTQIEDLTLAFFIARLVDARFYPSKSNDSCRGGLSITTGYSLRKMGGERGFQSTLSDRFMSVDLEEETLYKDWLPKLLPHSRDLLNARGISGCKGDPSLQAVLLLWLNRPNDATMCLFGRTFTNHKKYTDQIGEEVTPPFFGHDCNLLGTPLACTETNIIRLIYKSNAWINFSCRYLVLSKMCVHLHVEWASALLLARYLTQCGMEFSSINTLLQVGKKNMMIEQDHDINDKYQLNILLKTDITPVDSFKPDTCTYVLKPLFHTGMDKKKDFVPSSNTSSFNADDVVTLPIFERYKTDILSTQPYTCGSVESSIFDSYDIRPSLPGENIISDKPTQKSSSLFNPFDIPVPPDIKRRHTCDMVSNKNCFSNISAMQTDEIFLEEADDSFIPPLPLPTLWMEWHKNLLTITVARILLREIAGIIAPFFGDPELTSIDMFAQNIYPIVPHNAHVVLKDPCDGVDLLSNLVNCLNDLCALCSLNHVKVVKQALLILSIPTQPRRILFLVLLHCLTGCTDLAEDVIRNAARDQIQRCEMFTISSDDLVYQRMTKHHISSLYVRRIASNISWQLELCLWLHRGGVFPLSGIAIKEATIAVLVGLFIASWSYCHESLKTILKYEPDCKMDYERGRQLWNSIKLFSSQKDEHEVNVRTSSGGWEFLVDCRREEATNILRNREPGSFLLRPHMDDHGVFTLSFRTNLVATNNNEDDGIKLSKLKRSIKQDDVVQHAVVRLSDAGFRCGSFGPFSSLLKLLESVSTSLPFELLFNEPPVQGIIKKEGNQPSPNSMSLRKLVIRFNSKRYQWNNSTQSFSGLHVETDFAQSMKNGLGNSNTIRKSDSLDYGFDLRRPMFFFSQLLILTEFRKRISAIASAEDEVPRIDNRSWMQQHGNNINPNYPNSHKFRVNNENIDNKSNRNDFGVDDMTATALRIIRPLLDWCRASEASIVSEIIPSLSNLSQSRALALPVAVAASETAVEAATTEVGICIDGGDFVIRQMIQPGSGVEFCTLRVGDGGHSAVVVLFSKHEALSWFVGSGAEKNEVEAGKKLEMMEKRRVIEQIDLGCRVVEKPYTISSGFDANQTNDKGKDIRYRFVDPWEVEALESKDGELRNVSLGREHYVSFSIGHIMRACEKVQHSLGGFHLLTLWNALNGGICLTKSLASVHPPWERDAGGDMPVKNSNVTHSPPYENCIHQHLYRNELFRRLKLPQRFLALVQVELLDLKNLTFPSASSSLTVYALLRLKRTASNTPLTHKARTLDSACTEPIKIGKSSGPNAPVSWGRLVRFRFPLPEEVDYEGVSFDRDREVLFKGPPCVLQMSVYEKKFMTDVYLGGADISLDDLACERQLEEWVPLRLAKDAISWFARIRLTLRFELMCLKTEYFDSKGNLEEICPSVGARKIFLLSRMGGAHEDVKGFKKSTSTPESVAYLESVVLHDPG